MWQPKINSSSAEYIPSAQGACGRPCKPENAARGKGGEGGRGGGSEILTLEFSYQYREQGHGQRGGNYSMGNIRAGEVENIGEGKQVLAKS